MENEKIILLVVVGLGFLFGYFWAIDKCNNSFNELNELKIRYTALNESYTQKVQENLALKIENDRLKSQQKQLSQQIANYLVEQASIDLLGIKKYAFGYDLLKIAVCNNYPSFALC